MTPREALSALDLVLAEDAQRESAIVRESGVIEQPDPCDVLLVSGYYANLPQYRIDAVYRRNGVNYVDVSPAGRSAFEPADVTTYAFALQERNVDGADVECLCFEEVAWSDATKCHLRGEEP